MNHKSLCAPNDYEGSNNGCIGKGLVRPTQVVSLAYLMIVTKVCVDSNDDCVKNISVGLDVGKIVLVGTKSTTTKIMSRV